MATGRAGGLDDPVWLEDQGEGSGQPAVTRGRTHRVLASFVLAVVFVPLRLGAAALISSNLVRTYEVPSASMAPTIKPDTRVSALLVGTTAHRGDIVVLNAPPQAQRTGLAPSVLIKRVVAAGGDTVACCQGDHLVINGRPASEGYAVGPQPPFGLVRVPRGELFVLGDNRSDSQDSKLWGPIPTALVVGQVVAQGPDASLLSPMVLGAAFALIVMVLVWLLGVRRLSAWRGA